MWSFSGSLLWASMIDVLKDQLQLNFDHTNRSRKILMKFSFLAATILSSFLISNDAPAQTKSERCAIYARDAARSTPTSTGVVRGAARGATAGAIFGGDAGRGAAIGAVVGGARRANQRSHSYQYYYDNCMRR